MAEMDLGLPLFRPLATSPFVLPIYSDSSSVGMSKCAESPVLVSYGPSSLERQDAWGGKAGAADSSDDIANLSGKLSSQMSPSLFRGRSARR